jgi:glutathione peroxidase
MCKMQGKVALVVNVASKCGYTPQYAPLQKLQDDNVDKGFYVLGFPSNSFNQEFGSGDEISQFCRDKYGISFPMFALGDVNGPRSQEFYKWIKSKPIGAADIEWNFVKFLVSRKGEIVARFKKDESPDSKAILDAINAELAKAP